MTQDELERLERMFDKRDEKLDRLREHVDQKFDAVHARITESDLKIADVRVEMERKGVRWGVISGAITSLLAAAGLHFGSKQ